MSNSLHAISYFKERDRFSVRSVLVLIDNYNTSKIGDTIIRVSKLKFIKHYFPHAGLDINTPSGLWKELTLHSPFIDNVSNHTPDEIEYNKYDLIILFVDKRSVYLKAISDYVETHEMPADFSVTTLYDPVDADEKEVAIPYLNGVFEYSYPQTLIDDVNKSEVWLTDEELSDATKLLDKYVKDEKLILFFYNASYYAKMLKMSETVRLIKYFQSLSGHKLVLFDPFNENKEQLLQSLGVDTNEILFLKSLSLRETFAVMADKRTELILGPCTGPMHGASAVYNFMMKNKGRSKKPIMLVYTGLYTGEVTNASIWWTGKLVDCMVLKKDATEGLKIYKLEEIDPFQMTIQKDVAPCNEYTSEMIKQFLKRYDFATYREVVI